MKKEIRIGQPLSIDNVTIVPLEEVTISGRKSDGTPMFYFSKSPLGVAVATPQRAWVIGIEGETINLKAFPQLAPRLRQILSGL